MCLLNVQVRPQKDLFNFYVIFGWLNGLIIIGLRKLQYLLDLCYHFRNKIYASMNYCLICSVISKIHLYSFNAGVSRFEIWSKCIHDSFWQFKRLQIHSNAMKKPLSFDYPYHNLVLIFSRQISKTIHSKLRGTIMSTKFITLIY